MLRLQAWPIVLAKAQKAAAAVHKVSAGTGVVDVDTTAARLTAGEHCLWVSLSYLQFSQPRQCFGLSLAPENCLQEICSEWTLLCESWFAAWGWC